jgi:VanZ family protein
MDRRSLWLARVVFVGGLCLVIVGSLLPGAYMPALIDDKAEHFFAYAALAVAGTLACRTQRTRVLMALFLCILALGLEVAQAVSPGRSTEFADAVAGWMGICSALVLLRLVRTRRFG